MRPAQQQASNAADRDRLRAIDRARAAKGEATARRRADVIHDDARLRAKDCRCPIKPLSTLDQQLRAFGAGCTAGRWVCPTIDAIRRRLGA